MGDDEMRPCGTDLSSELKCQKCGKNYSKTEEGIYDLVIDEEKLEEWEMSNDLVDLIREKGLKELQKRQQEKMAVEIIARANDPENVWKLYNAGADYVLSLPDVTGEVLASVLIEDAEIFTTTDDFDFVRIEGPALEGQSIAEADVRNEMGSTIVGVERDEQFISEFGADFVFQSADRIIATGSDESLERLEEFVT